LFNKHDTKEKFIKEEKGVKQGTKMLTLCVTLPKLAAK